MSQMGIPGGGVWQRRYFVLSAEGTLLWGSVKVCEAMCMQCVAVSYREAGVCCRVRWGRCAVRVTNGAVVSTLYVHMCVCVICVCVRCVCVCLCVRCMCVFGVCVCSMCVCSMCVCVFDVCVFDVCVFDVCVCAECRWGRGAARASAV